jgi:dihydroxyacetone synthase
MAPPAATLDSNDVAHLPVKLNGKAMNGGAQHVENVQLESADKTQFVLRSYRCLIADLCQQFNMGHPG